MEKIRTGDKFYWNKRTPQTGPKSIGIRKFIDAIRESKRGTLTEIADILSCSIVNVYQRIHKDYFLKEQFEKRRKEIREQVKREVKRINKEVEEIKVQPAESTPENEAKREDEGERIKRKLKQDKLNTINQKEWRRTAQVIFGDPYL